ncbi:transposase family protein [Parasediminibacterium sp. JCM 36343]|uniref:transposase family protein n=1 Tax=Parasediminibacterium sp. JCM 36343 TaxID=3374279 RepID=UPI003979E71B
MAYNAYSNLFISHFESLENPRRPKKGNFLDPLTEVLFMVVTAMLCGYSYNECIADFGRMNLDWLRKYFPYVHVTCSHDVIGRLLHPKNNTPHGYAFCNYLHAKFLIKIVAWF